MRSEGHMGEEKERSGASPRSFISRFGSFFRSRVSVFAAQNLPESFSELGKKKLHGTNALSCEIGAPLGAQESGEGLTGVGAR